MPTELPRHHHLALAAIEQAFAERRRDRLGQVNEDLQPVVDAAMSWICELERERDEAVQEAGRLRGEHHSLRDVLQWVNDQCPGKCSAVCDSALRAGHEGSHAEALGDNGGTRG